jgi:hypothetical protein
LEQFKFEKSTCEKYTIRWGSCGWAVITIDENGLFNCQSDYGDYQYMWPHHGRKSFKYFILELARDTHYLLKKVSNKNRFNYEKSLKSWEKAIVEFRKERGCTKQQARDAWDFLHSLDDYSNNATIIQKEIYESDAIAAICPDEPWYMFDTIMEYPPGAICFANEVMPMFAAIIKQELGIAA